MIALLLQIFVSLVVAMGIGLGVGLVLGRRQYADHPTPPDDSAAIGEIVAREAELIECLSRAEDDLRAHAVELADANEEITVLLDHLFEARSTGGSDTPLPR